MSYRINNNNTRIEFREKSVSDRFDKFVAINFLNRIQTLMAFSFDVIRIFVLCDCHLI